MGNKNFLSFEELCNILKDSSPFLEQAIKMALEQKDNNPRLDNEDIMERITSNLEDNLYCPHNHLDAHGLTVEELEESKIPDAFLHGVDAEFSYKLNAGGKVYGVLYMAKHLTYEKDSNKTRILLCGPYPETYEYHDGDYDIIKDFTFDNFKSVETIIAKETNGQYLGEYLTHDVADERFEEPKYAHLHNIISPSCLKHGTIADLLVAYSKYFENVKIGAVRYENIPKNYAPFPCNKDDVGLPPDKLEFIIHPHVVCQ